jgi:hypothetical protein
MGHLGMLDQHNHLFRRDKSLKVVPRVFVISRQDMGNRAIPMNTNRNREQVLHQGSLVRELDLNGSITEAAESALCQSVVVLFDGSNCITHSVKFDISIVGLASDTFHDYVNWLIHVIEDTGSPSEESNNFGSTRREWNLYINM